MHENLIFWVEKSSIERWFIMKISDLSTNHHRNLKLFSIDLGFHDANISPTPDFHQFSTPQDEQKIFSQHVIYDPFDKHNLPRMMDLFTHWLVISVSLVTTYNFLVKLRRCDLRNYSDLQLILAKQEKFFNCTRKRLIVYLISFGVWCFS